MNRGMASRSRWRLFPPLLSTQEIASRYCFQFWAPSTGKTINRSEFSGGPPRCSGLEHLPCEKKLRKWRLLPLEKRRLWMAVTAVSTSYEEVMEKVELFTIVQGGRSITKT